MGNSLLKHAWIRKPYLCLIVPPIWLFCLVQCWLGMPQDMSIVKAQIKQAWRGD